MCRRRIVSKAFVTSKCRRKVGECCLNKRESLWLRWRELSDLVRLWCFLDRWIHNYWSLTKIVAASEISLTSTISVSTMIAVGHLQWAQTVYILLWPGGGHAYWPKGKASRAKGKANRGAEHTTLTWLVCSWLISET